MGGVGTAAPTITEPTAKVVKKHIAFGYKKALFGFSWHPALKAHFSKTIHMVLDVQMKGYASPPPSIPSSMVKLNNPCFWLALAWPKAGIVAFGKEIHRIV